jgi:teichuronic acid biosynthesis glycosyltransferase TuaC
MKVLAVTNMLPTSTLPTQGTFVGSQLESLKGLVDLQILHINRPESGRKVYSDVRSRVRQAFAEGKPDLVHVMYGGALGLLVATSVHRLPMVITFRGSDLLGDPQRSLKRRVFGRTTVLASKLAALRANAIITVSQQLADAVPAIVSRDRVHVIPNGVNVDHFRPLDSVACRRQLGWSEQDFNVLFAGAPDNETKRYSDAHAAVECLRARGVPAQLRLMRGVPPGQVPVWINAAHVMLLCSLHEGSPNIVKESLACECPVVSTRVGDVAERLAGIDGCFLSDRDAHKLADCLEAVFRRGARLNSRDKILPLAAGSIAERVVSIYRSVCVGPQALARAVGHSG